VKLKYFIDPKTNKESVSLTLMLVSFVILVVLSTLKAMESVSNVGAFQELFYATAALYFGRRVSVNNKLFSSTSTKKKRKTK